MSGTPERLASQVWLDRVIVLNLTIWALHGARTATVVGGAGRWFLAAGILAGALLLWPTIERRSP